MVSTKKYLAHAIAGVAILGILVAGCGSKDNANNSSDSGGKTLVIDNVFSLKSADPARNYEPTGNIVARALYEHAGDVQG